MSWIDFILNLAGLLLWLNWLAPRVETLVRTSAASLVGTLKKADYPSKTGRWGFLAALVGVLIVRGVVYWEIGPSANWTPGLPIGTLMITVAFRSDFLSRMLLFSALSFALTLALFYLWMLFFSVINFRVPDLDPLQRLVRVHLGRVERWPRMIRWLLPPVIAGLAWLALQPMLAHLGMVPAVKNRNQLLEQVALIGAGSYLAWKYLIGGILLLHLLNSYVYLGNHPVWVFINATARSLLAPLRWLPLRFGRVDFAPLVAIALVFLIAESAARGLTFLCNSLPR